MRKLLIEAIEDYIKELGETKFEYLLNALDDFGIDEWKQGSDDGLIALFQECCFKFSKDLESGIINKVKKNDA